MHFPLVDLVSWWESHFKMEKLCASHPCEQSLTSDSWIAQGCWRQCHNLAHHCPYTVVVSSPGCAFSTAQRSSWEPLVLFLCQLIPTSPGFLTHCFLVQMTDLQCVPPHWTTASPRIGQIHMKLSMFDWF